MGLQHHTSETDFGEAMFQLFDHIRTRLTTGPRVERSESVKAGMPGSGVFYEELARLRGCWVESHRAFNAVPASERDRAILDVHASANAYFEHLDRIRAEDHVPMQVRHGLASASPTPAKARTLLRLVPSS